MTIFTETDISTYAPDVTYTGSQLSALILQVENYIAGKLKKQTLEDYTYKDRLELSSETCEFYLNQSPLVSIALLKVRYSQMIDFGRNLKPDWKVLVPDEDYEVDTYDGKIELIENLIITGKKKIECTYVSGFSNLTENINPVDLNTLKIAIAKGIEILDSGIASGMKTETYQGETSVTYFDVSGRNALEVVLEPYLKPLMKWSGF